MAVGSGKAQRFWKGEGSAVFFFAFTGLGLYGCFWSAVETEEPCMQRTAAF
jgi:hypothetical protein